MKIKHFYKILLLLIVTGFSVSCSKNDDEDPELSVSVKTLIFESEGGTSEEISIDANSTWTVANSGTSWIQMTKTSGGDGNTVTTITALANETKLSRSVILTFEADNGQARRIIVKQLGKLYPYYNVTPIAPDETGMSSNAVQLMAKMQMGMGINFGNTLEAPTEGDWAGPVTESYVKFLKQKGFSAVRIPCSWVANHLDDPNTMKINDAWLARVKQVVGWCVANDMYAVLNVHYDDGWLHNNIDEGHEEEVNAKQKALWEQIATTMRDFDEHLIFAGANEPPAHTPEQMAILTGYYETFIKAVRSTGGKNSYRVLVVQGPDTSANVTYDLMNTMPTDKVPNKLMLEFHTYTPSLFTIVTDGDVSWGDMIYYWGAGNHSTIEPDRNATFGEEDEVDAEMQKMKQKFVDKGIPVILGEYSAWRRNAIHNANHLPRDLAMHNKSVDYWTYYVTKQAKANGIMPLYWEIGFMLDRDNNVVLDQDMFDALVEGFK